MRIHLATISILFLLLAGGCVHTVTRTELDEAIGKRKVETCNSVIYLGTEDGFHYLVHSYTMGSKGYRIPIDKLQIDKPFPRTDDRKKWRILKENWDAWNYDIDPLNSDGEIFGLPKLER